MGMPFTWYNHTAEDEEMAFMSSKAVHSAPSRGRLSFNFGPLIGRRVELP
jgi:hypothetical protein